MKRYTSTLIKGLLLLSILISIIGTSVFPESDALFRLYFEAKQYREWIYALTMPMLLVVGIILELILYSKRKRIVSSFVYSGYLNLVVIAGVSYWLLLSIDDGLALIGILGMSMTAYVFISIIQLFVLFIVKQRQKLR